MMGFAALYPSYGLVFWRTRRSNQFRRDLGKLGGAQRSIEQRSG